MSCYSVQVPIAVAKSHLGAKSPCFSSISRFAGEREKISTSNHLIMNTNTHIYLHAKFRGDPRYKNVQGQIVGRGFTVPRAQVQL